MTDVREPLILRRKHGKLKTVLKAIKAGTFELDESIRGA